MMQHNRGGDSVTPILIDTDPGIDDALALLLAWSSPEIQVDAITTVDAPGNVAPRAEFNMHVDPEAAHRVLAARLPLELVPLDATRQAVLPRAGMRAALARSPGPLASRIQAFSERAFRIAHGDGSQGMALHDPLAVAVAIDPSLAKWEAMRLAIGPDGETVRASGTPNCRLAKGVESDRFLRLFLDRLCPATSRRSASS